jgi:hypothetical protein
MVNAIGLIQINRTPSGPVDWAVTKVQGSTLSEILRRRLEALSEHLSSAVALKLDVSFNQRGPRTISRPETPRIGKGEET